MAFLSVLAANAMLLADLAAMAASLGLFAAGLAASIVFAAGTRKRHLQGRKLGGKIAIPLALFASSLFIAIPLAMMALL